MKGEVEERVFPGENQPPLLILPDKKPRTNFDPRWVEYLHEFLSGSITLNAEMLLFVAAEIMSISTSIETPDRSQACEYCDSKIFDHDPLCVRDCTDDCGSPRYYCNYACLSAHIDDAGLTTGDACEWSPE